MSRRVVIAAGGTAGHVVPALAVADALREQGVEATFVGGQRAERDLVPAAGYPFERIRVEGISRTNPFKAVRAVARAAVALVRSWQLLGRLRPVAVLGGGGYVAGPVALAAVARRIPIVLTEADSHLGLTNRVLAPLARRICLAFPIAGREPPRFRVTGRPVPPPATDRDRAREQFGLGPEDRCVLVFGGSLGARSINQAAVEAFADAPFRVIHAAGARDFPSLRAPGERYDLREYINPFGPALLAADVVVARAGGSVFEIASHGRPAILIPYPHATADHQTTNARWMADAGAAVVIADRELTAAGLRATVDELLADPERLASMGRASAALAKPDAAGEIAAELLNAAER